MTSFPFDRQTMTNHEGPSRRVLERKEILIILVFKYFIIHVTINFILFYNNSPNCGASFFIHGLRERTSCPYMSFPIFKNSPSPSTGAG